jgi:hypothetical protein
MMHLDRKESFFGESGSVAELRTRCGTPTTYVLYLEVSWEKLTPLQQLRIVRCTSCCDIAISKSLVVNGVAALLSCIGGVVACSTEPPALCVELEMCGGG